MNPLLLTGIFSINISVDHRRLTIWQPKAETISFDFRRCPYDIIVIDAHGGRVSFDALRWLAIHDITLVMLRWNGELMYESVSGSTGNGKLRIAQYVAFLNKKTHIIIAKEIIKQKIDNSISLLSTLQNFYSDIDLTTIRKEAKSFNKVKTTKEIMTTEGRIAEAYWYETRKIFAKIAPDMLFESRRSSSNNISASTEISASLNYAYSIIEAISRKYVNAIGLDRNIGFNHAVVQSKEGLIYDIQELARYAADLSVIQLFETSMKHSDFIVTENFHIRLKPDTAKQLVKILQDNLNRKYPYKNGKNFTLENILFQNVRNVADYVMNNTTLLKFDMPSLEINRNDTFDMQNLILSIDTKMRKSMHINKSSLWYQQKKLKEGKPIKLYAKTRAKIQR